jgi:ElaB/YqjD/DUF883 family membrane-anchored ribosome-binding protein
MIDINPNPSISDVDEKSAQREQRAQGQYQESAAGAQPFTQRAHAFVDRATQALGSGSERVMQFQQQYGDKAREQVRAKPLAAVGVAVAVGLLVSKLFMK